MFKRFLKKCSLADYCFRSDIFPTVANRVFWDAFQNDNCIAEAESEMEYAWPTIRASAIMEYKKSGDRLIMEDVHFDRRNHLVLFALAELKENKGRFLSQIVDGLFVICEESYWGLSAHWIRGAKNIPTPAEPYIDLFAAETAEQLTMVTALLREPLATFCPEILDRVAYELEIRIKHPYLTHYDYWWMGYHRKVNNWNPWILSNLLTVFLLAEKNECRLHRALAKMLEEIQTYYDSMPADGGCDEGPGYWGRAGASLFEFLYQLKVSTDGAIDFFGDEKIRAIATYLQKAHTVADFFANVADAHFGSHAGSMPLLFGFARETKQSALMNFSAAVYRDRSIHCAPLHHGIRTMRRLIYHAEFLQEMERYPVTEPLHGALEYLPDLQLATLRKGSMCLSAKGGHNDESHNHNDVGSFTLFDGMTPVLIDVGISAYTRFTFQRDKRYTVIPWTQTYTHNLPLFGGVGQKFGSAFCADKFTASDESVEISFAGAYPSEAGVKSLTRTLSLLEKGAVCTDRFTAVACQVTEVLVTALPVRVEDGVAILDECYRVSASCGNVTSEFLPFADATLERDWKAEGVHRILIDVADAAEVTITVEKL